jgi:hypothetical protein
MSIHGKDSYFGVEDSTGTTIRNLTPYLNSIDFNQSNDTHDDTTMGAEGHTYRAGLTDGTISLAGIWDKTATTGADTVLQSLVGVEITVGFEYGPEGNTAGQVKKSGECVLESYAESAPVADLVTWTASFKISGNVTKGVFP